MNWNDSGLPDDYLAAMPFPETQDTFSAGGTLEATSTIGTVGWHGTDWDPATPAFAIASPSGPFAAYVGERLKVSYGKRSVYVYLYDESNIAEQLSLSRRAFMALASPATDELVCRVEVMA